MVILSKELANRRLQTRDKALLRREGSIAVGIHVRTVFGNGELVGLGDSTRARTGCFAAGIRRAKPLFLRGTAHRLCEVIVSRLEGGRVDRLVRSRVALDANICVVIV